MTLKDIQELIRLLNKTNITEFKLKDGEFEVTIRTEEYTRAKNQPTVLSAAPVMPVSSAPVHSPISMPPVAAPSTPSPAPESAPAQEAPKAAPVAEGSGNYIQIKSPMVGTFYRSPSPEKPPYVNVGDSIQKGTTVCVIEAMKLFNEIESELSGKIVKVLVDDAQPVEYDQPLFLVDPKG